MFYAKGGLAVGQVTAGSFDNSGGTFTFLGVPLATVPASTTKWATGWTVGGGMEFALTDKWSAKAEYMHYDLGQERFVVNTIPGFDVVDSDTRGDVVRVGVNYHFHPMREPVPLK